MGNKRDVILPSHHDEKALADRFCDFFVGKILAARSSSEYHSVLGRSIMFFDVNGACLSMMELSSDLFDRNGNPSGDHFALLTSLEISKPPKQRNTVSYRKFSEINTTDLIQDLNNSKITTVSFSCTQFV
jgi:hypothetical protein